MDMSRRGKYVMATIVATGVAIMIANFVAADLKRTLSSDNLFEGLAELDLAE